MLLAQARIRELEAEVAHTRDDIKVLEGRVSEATGTVIAFVIALM